MTDNNEKLLDIYLAEYNSLRSEIIARTQTQNQVLNFLLIIMGAAISAVVVSANSNIDIRLILLIAALFLPLITFPLAFIFFDAEIMIHATGSHLHENLRKYISDIVEANKPNNDRHVFESTWDFKYLDSTTKARQHLLSVGRWLVFLVPTLVPVLSLLVYSIVNWEWWSKNLIPLSTMHSTTIIISGFVVFFINILMSLLLLLGIGWTLNRCKELGRPTFSFQLWKSLIKRQRVPGQLTNYLREQEQNDLTVEETERREDEFEQYLLAKGVISHVPTRDESDEEFDSFEMIKVEGEQLSETIIRERQ